MRNLSALVHLSLSEAEQRLTEEALPVTVIHTAPPRGAIAGTERVVRVAEREGTVVLTAAFYPDLQE